MTPSDPITAGINLAGDVLIEAAKIQAQMNTPQMIEAKRKQDEIDAQAAETQAVRDADIAKVRAGLSDSDILPI